MDNTLKESILSDFQQDSIDKTFFEHPTTSSPLHEGHAHSGEEGVHDVGYHEDAPGAQDVHSSPTFKSDNSSKSKMDGLKLVIYSLVMAAAVFGVSAAREHLNTPVMYLLCAVAFTGILSTLTLGE